MVLAEIHSLCCVFFLPRTSSHVSCQSFLQCSHCVSMSFSSSSVSSCSGWNLLERLIWKAACVSLSLSSPTLYFVRVLLALVNLLRRSLTVVIRRWWSDDTSAPLITPTSRHDVLNLQLMHMWSIWFSVTWCGCACVGRCFLLSPTGSGRTGLQSAHHFHSSVPVHVSP